MGASTSIASPECNTSGSALVSRQRPLSEPVIRAATHRLLATIFAATPDGSIVAIRKLHVHTGVTFPAHPGSRVVGIGFVFCGASKYGVSMVSPNTAAASSPAPPPSIVSRWCGPPILAPSECTDVIVTAANDGRVRVWESATGACVADFIPFVYPHGSPTPIVAMAWFSPPAAPFATSVHDSRYVQYTGEYVVVAMDGRISAFNVTVRQGRVDVHAHHRTAPAHLVNDEENEPPLDAAAPADAAAAGSAPRIGGSWIAAAADVDFRNRGLELGAAMVPHEVQEEMEAAPHINDGATESEGSRQSSLNFPTTSDSKRASSSCAGAKVRRHDAVFACGDGIAVVTVSTSKRQPAFNGNTSSTSASSSTKTVIETRFVQLPMCRNACLAVAASNRVAGSRRVAFAAGFDSVVAVCLSDTDSLLWTVRGGHESLLTAIAVSHDATRIATSCADGTVVLRSSLGGTVIDRVPAFHEYGATQLHFLGDDRALAATGGRSVCLSFLKLPDHPRHALHRAVSPRVLPADVVVTHVAPFLVCLAPTAQ